MRKWGAEHPVLVAALVLALSGCLLVAVDLGLGRSLDHALFNAAFWTAAIGLSWFFAAKRLKTTADRLAEHGQVLAYVRYPKSRSGSLSGIWNMGVATLAPGRIEFQPAVYDSLELSGRPTSFTVLDSSPVPRSITRQDSKYVSHRSFRVVTLTTDEADVEMAASPATLQNIRDVVRAHPPTTEGNEPAH